MIIQAKIRGFICTTAHPKGCFKAVENQIAYVKSAGNIPNGPKRVLIIGGSTGYGLASRITSAFACGAKTLSVAFEKPADDKRTATAGWYNTAAFETLAHEAGLYAKSLNGDAFSNEMKKRVAECIREDFGKIDLLVYSLASPRRTHPETGETFSSVLKPIGKPFQGKTVDAFRGDVKEVSIEPALPEEIADTIEVMGGDDWSRWIHFLKEEQLLSEGFKTVAYSYLGPVLTHAIYKEGTIGQAKADLLKTAKQLSLTLKDIQGEALLSVNKALVTQSSAAIPVVPLYISLLYKLMKEKGTHEGCIEQCYRLFKDFLYANTLHLDALGQIRIDDLEMDPNIQKEIEQRWAQINSENVMQLSDLAGYRKDFYQLFGFDLEGVDYAEEVNPQVRIPSIPE